MEYSAKCHIFYFTTILQMLREGQKNELKQIMEVKIKKKEEIYYLFWWLAISEEMCDLFYMAVKQNYYWDILNCARNAAKYNNVECLDFIYRFAEENGRLHELNNDRLIGITAIQSSYVDIFYILHSHGYDFNRNILSDVDNIFTFIGEKTKIESVEYLLSLGLKILPSFFNMCAWRGLMNLAENVIQKYPATRDYFSLDFTLKFLDTNHMMHFNKYKACLRFIEKNKLLKLETPKDVSLLLHYYVDDVFIEKNTMIEDCLLMKYASDARFFSRDDIKPLIQDPIYRFYFSKTLRSHYAIAKVQRLFRKNRLLLAERRMSVLKYELLEYAWHPDRFMGWCMNEEDRLRIQKLFC